MSDLQPFLFATVADPDEVRPFAALLPTRASPPAQSPWTPAAVGRLGRLGLPAPSIAAEEILAAARAEAAQLRADAVAAGRAEGLREAERQRETLTALAAELVRTQTARDAHAADLVSTAAVAVVEAWLGRAITGAERFAPIVRGWLAASAGAAAGEPADRATARVNPADVAAMREAIGEAPISVLGDASIAAGDTRITVGARELQHVWSERLHDLREAIAASVAAAGADPAVPGA